jgi:hypothetical protein
VGLLFFTGPGVRLIFDALRQDQPGNTRASLPPNKALQLTSAGSGVLGQRRPELAALAGRLVPAGGGARWATLPVSGARS